VLAGDGVPSDGEGEDGDFYVDTSANTIYGPKAEGSWAGTGPTNLVGPRGERGERGEEGEEGPEGPEGPEGEEGPEGPEGPEGEEGPEGPAGTNGVSGYQVVKTSESATVPNGSTVNLYPPFARCPEGKKLIGGGTASNGGQLLHSGPYVASDGTVYDIWESGVLYHNESGGTYTITVTAIAYCANVS
jgi:hypothetical protein